MRAMRVRTHGLLTLKVPVSGGLRRGGGRNRWLTSTEEPTFIGVPEPGRRFLRAWFHVASVSRAPANGTCSACTTGSRGERWFSRNVLLLFVRVGHQIRLETSREEFLRSRLEVL